MSAFKSGRQFSFDHDLDCAALPWRCPACQTVITHHPADTGPRPGARYRCHVCRLELALDEQMNRLELAPLESTDDQPAIRRAVASVEAVTTWLTTTRRPRPRQGPRYRRQELPAVELVLDDATDKLDVRHPGYRSVLGISLGGMACRLASNPGVM